MLVLVKAVLPDVYVVGELHELALAAGPTGWRGVWRSLVAQASNSHLALMISVECN